MMLKLLSRTSIIFFWVALIFAALYWPTWKVLSPFEENTLNIFTWGDILAPSEIAAFEQETGVKVHLNYYSSNEELMVKLKATQGEGYDLIIPSDYAVELLAKEDLLKELDKSQLKFWNNLNPRLLGHAFDPTNRFSIPFEWEIFGLGIDKEYFHDKPITPSWKMIFDPKVVSYKIAMINDPIETLLIAGYYLYGPTPRLNTTQRQEVKELLLTQKKWVEAYANFRADYYLATRNCPVVLASSSYIWRTMRQFDFVGFVIPKEGSFITVENVSIPRACKKEKLVYNFLNFLYRPKTVAAHYKEFGFFPATLDALDLMELDPQMKKLILSNEEEFKKFYFTETLLPEQDMRDLWVEIKGRS